MLLLDKEGLPLALPEAMACGLPAVVTEMRGPGEVVSHEEIGLLVRRGSTEELARGIRCLLVDSVMCDSMGAPSRRCTDQHFDID